MANYLPSVTKHKFKKLLTQAIDERTSQSWSHFVVQWLLCDRKIWWIY